MKLLTGTPKSSPPTRIQYVFPARPGNLQWLIAFGLFWIGIAPLSADHLQNVRLRLVNGSSIRATVDSIDQQGVIEGSEILRGVSLNDVVALDTGRAVSAKSKTEKSVYLSSGGRIPFADVKIANEILDVETGRVNRQIALEIVRAIVWKDSPVVANAISETLSESDSVVVQTSRGERIVRGLIEAVDETHVSIFYDGKSRRISREKVRAIVTAKLDFEQPTGATATIQLVDGSRIVGSIIKYQENQLHVALSAKQKMVIDSQTIAKFSIESDRVVYLSELQPIREEQQSQFAAPRPWQRDKSLLGNPLQLKFGSSSKIHEFEKGIGTRSYTSLVFINSGKFNQLRAVVGIDVETSGHGDCEMVVEGDGIRLWSKRVRATDDPEQLVVDITDIDEVALIVLPGENFDLADHADWADARFTKTD